MERLRRLPWLIGQLQPRPLASAISGLALAVFLAATAVPMVPVPMHWWQYLPDPTWMPALMAAAAGMTFYAHLVGGLQRGRPGAQLLVGATVGAAWLYGAVAFGGQALWFRGYPPHLVGAAVFVGVATPAALIGLVGLILGPLGLRRAWAEAQCGVVRAGVSRGHARLTDLCERARADEERVLACLSEDVDRVGDWLWERGHRDAAADMALAMLAARGRLTVRDLSRESGLRPQLVELLVRHLSADARFAGWVDWRAGVLVSAEAMGLDACPRCGGDLELAGRGVAECGYCDSEIFLPR